MTYLISYMLVVLSSFGHWIQRFPRGLIFNFIAMILIFIVALRYSSADYFSYLRIYNAISLSDLPDFGFFIYNISEATPVETGFALLVLLEKLAFGDFFVFIALFSFASLAVKFAAFKRMSPYFLLSLLLYMSNEYFWKDLGQIRNGFASGVVLWALYHAYYRRFLIFTALVLFAMLFHSAAIVAFPFYFVRLLANRHLMLTSLLLSFVVVIIFGGLGAFIIDTSSLLGLDATSRLVKYADSKYTSGASIVGGTVLLQTMLCLIFIFNYKKHTRVFPLAKFFTPVFVFTSCLFIAFNDYAIIGSRINDMLVLPVLCVLLPSMLLLFRGASKLVFLLFIILYSFVWFYMMMLDRPPYQSIVQFIF